MLIVIPYLFSDLTASIVVWKTLTNADCIITITTLFLYVLHRTIINDINGALPKSCCDIMGCTVKP